MYDSTTQFALDNLARQIARVDAGELTVAAGADAIRVAADALLRVTSPAAVEDREYFTVDLGLPISARCAARGDNGLVCSRRDNHVSPTHRCAEISWAVTA